MTLADELMGKLIPPLTQGRRICLEEPPLKLPFDGTLSWEEARLVSEGQLA